jgi:hypothetical protein
MHLFLYTAEFYHHVPFRHSPHANEKQQLFATPLPEEKKKAICYSTAEQNAMTLVTCMQKTKSGKSSFKFHTEATANRYSSQSLL